MRFVNVTMALAVIIMIACVAYNIGVKRTENAALGKCITAGATTSFCAALVRP